jgi:hypothetical protein
VRLLWRELLAIVLFVAATVMITSTVELRDGLLRASSGITNEQWVFATAVLLLAAAITMVYWPLVAAGFRQARSASVIQFVVAGALLIVIDIDLAARPPYFEVGAALGAGLLIAWGWNRKKRCLESPGRTADDPIDLPRDDALGRASLARDLVGGLGRPEAATRIAITGPWGSGKSTFLNFVSWYAERRAFVVVRFDAWHYRSRTEAWRGFVAAVDRAVNPHLGPLRWRSWLRVGASAAFTIATGTRSPASWFSELNKARLNATLDATKAEVTAALRAALGSRQILVVIDDLDRADDDVLRELLLAIKEIVNVEPCTFICGFDAAAVSQSLRERGGVRDPESYLSKIFQQTIPLPEPAIRYRDRFLEDVLREHPVIRRIDFVGMSEWLTKHTAREIKRFARQLASLHAFASRYGQDELNWRLLYMLELLRLEFPQAAAVTTHDDFAKWLPTAGFRRSDDRLSDLHSGWKPLVNDLVTDAQERMRFMALADGLAATTPARSESVIRMHLELLSGSEPLTWHEYRRVLTIVDRKGTDVRLRRSLLDERTPVERRREFVLAVARDQLLALEQESYAEVQSAREICLSRALRAGHLLLRISGLEGLHEGPSPILDGPSVKELIQTQLRYLHFDNPFYSEVRTLERQIIDNLIARVDGAAEWLLENTQGRARVAADRVRQVAEIWDAAHTQWRRIVAGQTLSRFGERDGLRAIWNGQRHWPTKQVLFERNDLFHNDATYSELARFADQAAQGDDVIQDNCLQAVLMLLHFAKDPSTLDRELVRAVLREDRFRETLWRGATERRIHRRVMGSLLLEDRPAIAAILRREDVLPVPGWVAVQDPDLLQGDVIEREDATEHRITHTDDGIVSTDSDARRDRQHDTNAGDRR